MVLPKPPRRHRSNSPALRLMLLTLVLTLTACASRSPITPAGCSKVAPPAIPALPPEAMQQPLTPECSPSCTLALTNARKDWQKLLTNPE